MDEPFLASQGGTKVNFAKMQLLSLQKEQPKVKDMNFLLTYDNAKNFMIALGLFTCEKDSPKELKKLCFFTGTNNQWTDLNLNLKSEPPTNSETQPVSDQRTNASPPPV